MYVSDLGLNNVFASTRKRWHGGAIETEDINGRLLYSGNGRPLRAIVRQDYFESPGNTIFETWADPWGHWGRHESWDYKSCRMHNRTSAPNVPVGWIRTNSNFCGCFRIAFASNAEIYYNNGNPRLGIHGNVYEYAVRPYYWSEEAVQEAYEVVSGGVITKNKINSLKYVYRDVDDGNGHRTEYGTDEEKAEVVSIHQNWDFECARYLAFHRKHNGVQQGRPFPSYDDDDGWGDDFDYTIATSHKGIRPHEYYDHRESRWGRREHTIQGFFFWRSDNPIYDPDHDTISTEDIDGKLELTDWQQIGRTILDGRLYHGNRNDPDNDKPSPALGPVDMEAFDLRIIKREFHPRKMYRDFNVGPNGDGTYNGGPISENNHPAMGLKNNLVQIGIRCTVVSGAKSAGTIRTDVDISPSAESLGILPHSQVPLDLQ